jgi:hypothetical protein
VESFEDRAKGELTRVEKKIDWPTHSFWLPVPCPSPIFSQHFKISGSYIYFFSEFL